MQIPMTQEPINNSFLRPIRSISQKAKMVNTRLTIPVSMVWNKILPPTFVFSKISGA